MMEIIGLALNGQVELNLLYKEKEEKAFLKELESALLAMPIKELIKDEWLSGGQVCSLGAVEVYRTMQKKNVSWGTARHIIGLAHNKAKIPVIKYRTFMGKPLYGYNTDEIEDYITYAIEHLDTTKTMAIEVMWHNDDEENLRYIISPKERYNNMLQWLGIN